jgi:hypothetical protein
MVNSENYCIVMCQLRIRKLVLFFLYISLSYLCVGQRERTFNHIEGCQVLYPNLTMESAKKKAIEQAKISAFQQAGFEEELSMSQMLKSEGSAGVSNDSFYELITSNVRGEITYFEVNEEKQSFGPAGEILICVDAKISVIQYPLDPSVSVMIEVENLNQVYKSGDRLSFELKTSEDGYLWIFIVDEQPNYHLIFPSIYDIDNKVKAGVNTRFPRSDLVTWDIITDQDLENNDLLFVFSRTPLAAPPSPVNFNEWSAWYQKIRYSDRYKALNSFQIIRK